MLFLNKTRQNIVILTIVFCFLALNFAATVENAQTKTGTKSTPTPAKKKTTPTPGKTAKAAPKTSSTPSKEVPQIIVVVASARVRSQASTASPELRRVKLGTLFKVLEKKDDWYKIQLSTTPKKVTGWMSSQVADDYDAARREEIYSRIIDKNYKSDGMSFADASELYEFLTKAQTEIKTPKLVNDASYKRLLALRAALKTIPSDKQSRSPYKEFLKLHAKDVVYSEPAGEWFVRSELFWNLHKKNPTAANAEEIAWAAANNPLPGECEGYVNCYLFLLRETDGEYLNLYPNGKYAASL